MKNTEIPSKYRALFDSAMQEWIPRGNPSVQKDLVGGRSAAVVAVVDLRPESKGPDSLASGEYILKLDERPLWNGVSEASEAERHNLAREANQEYANSHIPSLIRSLEENQQIALLYEIAGSGLAGVTTADSLDVGALSERGSQLVRDLLFSWNAGYAIEQMSTGDLLRDWLGYRLDPLAAPNLHKFLQERTSGKATYIEAGRLLANPYWLCMYEEVSAEARHSRFTGLIHGDLHPGNALMERDAPFSAKYWLIDFALARRSPLLYDQAYFELAVLLKHLDGLAVERIIGVLAALDGPDNDSNSTRVPVPDFGLVSCIRQLRTATNGWQIECEPKRGDPYRAQLLLARVAVALNWANKPMARVNRVSALAYGAWAATQYLKLFHERLSQQIFSHDSLSANSAAGTDVGASSEQISSSNQDLWADVWEKCGKFDAVRWKYVLVSARVITSPESASLGLLPWSLIVDMDPSSDVDGLQQSAAQVLSQRRSVSFFDRDVQPIDFQRGTAWLMAGGWPTRHEPVPSARDWRRLFVPRIRDALSELRRAVAPQMIKVVVLSGEGLSGDTMDRVLETIDESLGDYSEILVLGSDAERAHESMVTNRIALTLVEFIHRVHNMYGVRGHTSEPQIPGVNGLVSIPINELRNLQEDLDVLHSEVLTDENQDSIPSDSFWRGAPPTWLSLHAGADILREVHTELITKLEEALGESRNHTIELRHSPGAGGTTVAMRAAWDLHGSYPVAMIRRTSQLTLDRIDRFCKLSQRTVLLVADAAVLGTTARDGLYRGLVGRNARAVILYVVRTTSSDDERPLSVFAPMSISEGQKFYQHYSSKTNSAKRQKSIAQITTSESPQWKRYRIPFFYGLFTYEREFQSVERFVAFHLEAIAYKPRQVMLYLALLTRFSQCLLDESFVRSILGVPVDSSLPLEELIGRGPAALVVHNERRMKLLHPLIAEQTLRDLLGGHEGDSWKDGLKDLAIDFIRDVVRILGPDVDETNQLFVHLFIQRDVWYEREGKGRPRFAELIRAIRSKAGQHQVFDELTQVCPHEAHYWNHLGRHHFYELRSDFAEAEKYIEKAVELSPDDSYHHHSLGMVRRIWIEDLLADKFKADELPNPEDLMEGIEEIAQRASESFGRARELDPEDDHGYITHTQMIVHIAERLLRASGAQNLGGFSTWSHGRTAQWLKENIVVAEDLIAKLQHLRGQAQPSRYELKCVSGLSRLYGDFDAIIRTWEQLLVDRSGGEDLRRAIASAYYSRGRRLWGSLPDGDLRRVAELMDENLRSDPSNTRDIRMWFQAYRRLPEFSPLEALDRLENWAARADALDAHFYLYILHYLRYREGKAQNDREVLSNLERCKQGARGKRGHSYEWLGSKPVWCPLVHHSELGEWEQSINFYPDTSLLVRERGTIETIKGPQSGTIRISQSLRAFFVPGTHQWQSKDVNANVSFYLGFSYEGPRAWSVELTQRDESSREKGETSRSGIIRKDHVEVDKAGRAREGDLRSPRDAPKEVRPDRKSTQIAEMRVQAQAVVARGLTASISHGEELTLRMLAQALKLEFPDTVDVGQTLGYESLSAFVRSIRGLEIVNAGGRSCVRLTLQGRVQWEIERIVREAEGKGKQLYLAELGSRLRELFPEQRPVHQQLGFSGLKELVLTIREVMLVGEKPHEIVTRRK